MNWVTDLVAGLRDIAIIVFLGYGLKLMKQQNELLEREKSLKQSEIDLHKANIERLKILQAPAIAQDLERMTRTANEYATQKQKLEEQVKAMARENEAEAAVAGMTNIVGIAAGCLEATALMSKTRDRVVGLAALSGKPVEGDSTVEMLNRDIAYMATIGGEALEGKRPELKNLKALIADATKKRPSISTYSD